MAWDILDFAVFGAMLFGVGFTYALVRRKSEDSTYRIAMGIALAASFILIWVNGAVGIIGNANNDANMLYLGVLAVGIIGAIMARFRPRGMARALYATALAQVIVALIALMAGWGSPAPMWPQDLLALTAFFVVLWLFSAYLFQKSTRGRPPAAAELE